MVVLDKLALQACAFSEAAGVEAFEEKAALIAEHFWFEDDHTG